jgi:two-component system sensor kinase FixL
LVVSAAPAGLHTVEVAVADTGPGLVPEVAGRLFEPFVSTKPEGMGVGLAICRSIVEAHGGRLWAEPNPGGGTVFRFALPAGRPPKAGAGQGTAAR